MVITMNIKSYFCRKHEWVSQPDETHKCVKCGKVEPCLWHYEFRVEGSRGFDRCRKCKNEVTVIESAFSKQCKTEKLLR